MNVHRCVPLACAIAAFSLPLFVPLFFRPPPFFWRLIVLISCDKLLHLWGCCSFALLFYCYMSHLLRTEHDTWISIEWEFSCLSSFRRLFCRCSLFHGVLMG